MVGTGTLITIIIGNITVIFIEYNTKSTNDTYKSKGETKDISRLDVNKSKVKINN